MRNPPTTQANLQCVARAPVTEVQELDSPSRPAERLRKIPTCRWSIPDAVVSPVALHSFLGRFPSSMASDFLQPASVAPIGVTSHTT